MTESRHEPEPRRAALSGRRCPVHSGAARPVEPGFEPARQPIRHDRHGHRRADDARRASAGESAVLGACDRRHCHRRQHRRRDRSPCADDVDAGTGRCLSLPGGHGGGAGGGGSFLCTGRIRYWHARSHSRREPDRNVAGRRNRRRDFHRLGDRLPEAVRAHERQANHVAGAPYHQYCARGGAHLLRLRFLRIPEPDGFLADHRHFASARRAHDHSDWRRRHAGRDLDAQFLFGMGGRRHRLHARKFGTDRHRRTGRFFRRNPLVHHVQGDEPVVHLGHSRRLRRRNGWSERRGRAAAGQARLGRGCRLHSQEFVEGHHRAGLWHGGGAGAARAARDGR